MLRCIRKFLCCASSASILVCDNPLTIEKCEIDNTVSVNMTILKKIREASVDISNSVSGNSVIYCDDSNISKSCNQIKESLDYIFIHNSIDRLLTKVPVIEFFDFEKMMNRVIASISTIAELKNIKLLVTVDLKCNSFKGDIEKMEVFIWVCCRRIIEKIKEDGTFILHISSEVDITKSKTQFILTFKRDLLTVLTSKRDKLFFNTILEENNMKLVKHKRSSFSIHFTCDFKESFEYSESTGVVRRFLVVDDSVINLKVIILKIRKYLNSIEDLKYEIEQTTDGKYALELVTSKPTEYYSAVITDNEMKFMNGISLCSELRNLNYKFPIVAISSDDSSDFRRRFVSAGGTCAFSKPITDSQLPLIFSFL